MQGQRSSIRTMPENLSFDNDYTPSELQIFPQYEPSNIFSSDIIGVDSNANLTTNGSTLTPDLNHNDPEISLSIESSNQQAIPVVTSSSSLEASFGTTEHAIEESVNRRSRSCKRKSVEANAGPSSQIPSNQTEENLITNNGSDQMVNSTSPFSSNIPSRISEISRRNLRLRISESTQQDPDPGNSPFTNGPLHGQSVLLNVPSARRNPSWNGASSSRTIPEGRNASLYEEIIERNFPRSVSGFTNFTPVGGETNWNFASGDNNNIVAGNAASTPAPTLSPRNSPHYSRRLLEIVRRSRPGSASEGQNGNFSAGSSSSVTAEETTLSSGGQNGNSSNSRSALLERRIDGALYAMRHLASGSEGRSPIMSEIRRVLDLMQRGEGLRLEDMMILDQSVIFGMADIHDRHRDMRLNVDNMSYEELLALEERIGNVCTGLNEETITTRLKKRKYIHNVAENLVETEPCSICRDDYNDGDNLGKLECGHDFHKDCIKQWLMQKNLCPICKTTGLAT